ncbi:hypothetical protein, partial [Helicobacter sp. CLO-3]|uniref:hypothetical protein n=3 Tax=unclassified Helicobacter TaxID=2593540 RepID=UPI000AADA664
SDIVLFSAAIPYQGGTHHVNEQPPAYWADIFEKEGFVCFDILRERILGDASIDWCYRQNILIFIHKDKQDMLTKQGFSSGKPIYIAAYYIWKSQEDVLSIAKNYMRIRSMFAKIPFLKASYKKFIK